MKASNLFNKSIAAAGLSLVLSCLLTSCGTFGVSNEEWKQMTPQQREIVMQNYYRQQEEDRRHQAEIDRINAENAPINNLLSGLANELPSKTKTWSKSDSTTTGGCSGSTCTSKTNSSSSSVSVTTPF